MAIKNITAILKNRSAQSITLSVLVSFLFVFAFATSTTTISSTGITATGNGSFARLGIGTTTDPLYGLKAAKQDWYFDANSGGNADHVILENDNNRFRFMLQDVNSEILSYMSIDDQHTWTYASNLASGANGYIGLLFDNRWTENIHQFSASGIPDGSGQVVGGRFYYDFSLLDSAGDGYTALKVDVADAQAGAEGNRYLMDLQVGGASHFKVGAGSTNATINPTDLITNGSFTSDASGWIFDGGWSWNAGGYMESNGVDGSLIQVFGVTAGRTYRITYTLSGVTSGGVGVFIGNENNGGEHYSDGTYSDILVAQDTTSMYFYGSGNFVGQIDNVSVNEVVPGNSILTLTNAEGYQMPISLVGTRNILMGSQAGLMMANGAGDDGVFIGHQAGKSFSGSQGTFVGSYAMRMLQGGGGNTAFGSEAGRQLVTGDDNTLLGEYSGIGLSSGSGNTLVGSWAGGDGVARGNYSNNTFIGSRSGYLHRAGTQNFFGGYEAGFNNLYGYNDVFIGHESGHDNVNGFYNVALGSFSLRNSLGSENVAIGSWAGQGYGGIRAMFLGYNSGNSVSSGYGDVALGYETLRNLAVPAADSGGIATISDDGFGNALVTTSVAHGLSNGDFVMITGTVNYDGSWMVSNASVDAFNIELTNGDGPFQFHGNEAAGNWYKMSISANTALGYQAGFSNTIGDNNTFAGYLSGYANTTGKFNSFFGSRAGENNISGGWNAFFGTDSGKDHRFGNDNAFFGEASGRSNMYGVNNTLLGDSAGWESLGSQNTFVGEESGGRSRGSRLTFIGFESAPNNRYGQGDTGVGYQSLRSLEPVAQATGGITAFADSVVEPGVKTTVTSAGHGLSDGQEILIDETTNYNGVWIISNSTADTFDIELVFVSDDAAGNWYVLSQTNNTALGYQAGYGNTRGYGNAIFGAGAGYSNTTGFQNVIMGKEAGYFYDDAGDDSGNNVLIGFRAGYASSTAPSIYNYNTFVGSSAGVNSVSSTGNTFIGGVAGGSNESGGNNTYVGFGAGQLSKGSGNVFLGVSAGSSELGSNRLYIANSDPNDYTTASSTALIYGEFDNQLLRINGKLDVASTTATSTFAGSVDITGTLHAGVSYVGDLIFGNLFKFYEDPMPLEGQLATGTQSLKLTNQRNEDIFSIDEDGNLTIKGQLKQSTTTEQSVISLGLSWILDQFRTIGVTIADGIISAKEFIAEKVTAKRVVTDEFEMKSPNGTTFCVRVNDAGDFNKTQGPCSEQTQQSSPQPATPEAVVTPPDSSSTPTTTQDVVTPGPTASTTLETPAEPSPAIVTPPEVNIVPETAATSTLI